MDLVPGTKAFKDQLEKLEQQEKAGTMSHLQLKQLRKLQDQQVDIDIQLFEAVRNNNEDVVVELLSQGAMPDYQEPTPSAQPAFGEWDNPTNPLSLAAQNNNLEIVMLLLHELGEYHDQFDINMTDMSNETALHKAVNNNNEDIVVELLEHGIDKTIVGGEMGHVTAANLARRNGDQDLATLIEDHDYIDPGMPSMKGMLNQKYQVNYRQKYLKYKIKYLNLKN